MPAATTDRTDKVRGFRLFGEIISELKKVVWLSRQEVVYLTTLVLIVATAVGLFLGLIDLGFSTLVDTVLTR